jgi:hypothetical protein
LPADASAWIGCTCRSCGQRSSSSISRPTRRSGNCGFYSFEEWMFGMGPAAPAIRSRNQLANRCARAASLSRAPDSQAAKRYPTAKQSTSKIPAVNRETRKEAKRPLRPSIAPNLPPLRVSLPAHSVSCSYPVGEIIAGPPTLLLRAVQGGDNQETGEFKYVCCSRFDRQSDFRRIDVSTVKDSLRSMQWDVDDCPVSVEFDKPTAVDGPLT